MNITETKIKGVYIIEAESRVDERGYFFRVFDKEELKKAGIAFSPLQINQSLTKQKGTIRGLHFQKEPYQEDKYMQCIQGRTFNVAVDVRKDSSTYLQWVGVELNPENKKMFLVPKGCANGFQALEDNTIVQYPVSAGYVPDHESGIRWDDLKVGIDWPIKEVILSDKDKNWPQQ
jgi:dTDP-4-dehydrorhamnose 3,5-epimerase